MLHRFPIASFAASIVTTTLLALMTGLIAKQPGHQEPRPLAPIEPTSATPPPPPPSRVIEPPVKPERPAPTPVKRTGARKSTWVKPDGDPVKPILGAAPGTGLHELTKVEQHSNKTLVNIMSIPPKYPHRLLSRGIEGSVDLRFDVDKKGMPVNIVVIRSSNSGFEAPAIAAMRRFRYSGSNDVTGPVLARALEKRFTFEIDSQPF